MVERQGRFHSPKKGKHLSRGFTAFAALLVLFAFVVSAEAAPFSCAACHKDASILPASHKSYDMAKTNLCAACHTAGGKAKPLGATLHGAHIKKGMDSAKDCLACHEPVNGEVSFREGKVKVKAERIEKLRPYVVSWSSSKFMDRQHQEKGVSCLACHGTADYITGAKTTDTQPQCVKCHGNYPAMIAKTARSKYEKNPHKSHLPDPDCATCHHGHRTFEDICITCHKFGYKAPHGE
jgi:hypothetical protein